MALDGTSYPHLCTAHLSRPYVPMLCLWVPSHWPWNPSPQTGAGRQAPRHRCPRPPRRGTTQDGAGWRRMVKSMSERFCSAVHQYHETPWLMTDYSCCSNSIEFQLPLTRRVENLGLRMQLIGRKWNKWIVLRLQVRPLGPSDPGIPGEVEAPGEQRYPLPRLWVRPPELPCRREAPEREQAGWYGQGLVRNWTRWQGV